MQSNKLKKPGFVLFLTKLTSQDAVTGTLKAITAKLGEYMGSGDHVRVPFADMGVLLCEKRNASFKFGSITAPGMITSILSYKDRTGGKISEMDSWVDTFMKRKTAEVAISDAHIALAEAEVRVQEEKERLSKEGGNSPETQRMSPPSSSREAQNAQLAVPSLPLASSNQVDSARGKMKKEVKSRADLFQSYREPYSLKKDKLEESMANHVYPKFLIPEKPRKFKSTNPAVIRNMEIAYDRLEGTISKEQEALEKQKKASAELQEEAYQDYVSRKARARKLRTEITASLDAQSSFDREKRARELKEDREVRAPFLEILYSNPQGILFLTSLPPLLAFSAEPHGQLQGVPYGCPPRPSEGVHHEEGPP